MIGLNSIIPPFQQYNNNANFDNDHGYNNLLFIFCSLHANSKKKAICDNTRPAGWRILYNPHTRCKSSNNSFCVNYSDLWRAKNGLKSIGRDLYLSALHKWFNSRPLARAQTFVALYLHTKQERILSYMRCLSGSQVAVAF